MHKETIAMVPRLDAMPRDKEMIETEILIVGGGASGLSASMLLSKYGIKSLLVSKYPRTSNLPKAHVLSIKTMEIFREVGLETAIREISTPEANMRFAAYYAGFAGPGADYGREITRIGAWGRGGQDPDYAGASSVGGANLTQNRLEPLMKVHAERLAPDSVRFNHAFISFREESDSVVSTIEDRAAGERYEIRSRYLLACDGGRVIGPLIGVEMKGHLAVATSISIHFSADLSKWARDPEALTRLIMNPDTGVPCAIVPMGPEKWGPDSREWVVHLMSFAGDHKVYDDATAVASMLEALGLPDLKPEVHVINRWPLDAVVASHFRSGRVFVLGDGAHRMPPAGGHGMNTAIQDCYNLCWKIAAVLRGTAGDKLLDSYEMERKPVAERTVRSAFGSWQGNKALATALGFSPQNDAKQNWKNISRIWADGQEGDTARHGVQQAVGQILSSYTNLNINFGYTYAQGALVSDGTPAPVSIDETFVYQPSTRPGHSLPHAWLEQLHDRVALGDLAGAGRFLLIAGDKGESWCRAARAIAEDHGLPLIAFSIGVSNGDWLDQRYSWQRRREIGAEGAILVRPDRFIAWRAMAGVPDPKQVLTDVFARVMAWPS